MREKPTLEERKASIIFINSFIQLSHSPFFLCFVIVCFMNLHFIRVKARFWLPPVPVSETKRYLLGLVLISEKNVNNFLLKEQLCHSRWLWKYFFISSLEILSVTWIFNSFSCLRGKSCQVFQRKGKIFQQEIQEWSNRSQHKKVQCHKLVKATWLQHPENNVPWEAESKLSEVCPLVSFWSSRMWRIKLWEHLICPCFTWHWLWFFVSGDDFMAYLVITTQSSFLLGIHAFCSDTGLFCWYKPVLCPDDNVGLAGVYYNWQKALQYRHSDVSVKQFVFLRNKLYP